MIALTGRTEGLDDFEREALRETVPMMERAVDKAASMIEQTMERKLRRPGPSAPFQPPGEIEGHVRRSIGRSKVKTKGRSVAAWVGPGEGAKGKREASRSRAEGVNPFDYILVLEFGGHKYPGAPKIQPRPFIRPTWMDLEPKIIKIWESML